MLKQEAIQTILEHARQEEIKRGQKIEKIYVVGDHYYFDAWQVQGKTIDYTLVRSDMDPNYHSHLNTEPNLQRKSKREGF